MTTPSEAIAAAITNATIIADPLEIIVSLAKHDPGSVFDDDTIEQLAALKSENPARYQRIRVALQKARVNVRALDQLTGGDGVGSPRPSQVDTLMAVAEQADLFHTPDGDTYADVMIDGHRETYAIDGAACRSWLTQGFFLMTGMAPNGEALSSTIATMSAKARYEGQERSVHLRTAEHNGKLYIDLCDPAWRAVEIDGEGWRLVTELPVRFRRARGMLPLPVPTRGTDIRDLRRFLNVQSDADFVMAASWLAMSLTSGGPYPLLVVSGEQGSAKSTFSSNLRKLVDPNAAGLKSLPRDDRDLFITASNSHVIGFDNVSTISPTTSDALCRIATGGGMSTRKLYTDQDEVIFNVVKPMILNGIGEIVTRPDLADRSIFLELAPIPETARRPAKELEAEFEAARPGLFGALLDVVSLAFSQIEAVWLDSSPRMADFAKFGVACEPSFGPYGSFMAAFEGNREALIDGVIDSDPVANAVLAFAREKDRWSGSATALLTTLGRYCPEPGGHGMPKTPNILSECLKRAATFLRKKGVTIEFTREGRNRNRVITITYEQPVMDEQDVPS